MELTTRDQLICKHIKDQLIEMAINNTLPMDMNEIDIEYLFHSAINIGEQVSERDNEVILNKMKELLCESYYEGFNESDYDMSLNDISYLNDFDETRNQMCAFYGYYMKDEYSLMTINEFYEFVY